MSNVTLRIGGRTYRLGCPEGEEAHLEKLGKAIDAKLKETPGMSQQSEQHTLLYAALLMADALEEARNAIPAPAPEPAPQSVPDIAAPLENLAVRLEMLAGQLEDAGATP